MEQYMYLIAYMKNETEYLPWAIFSKSMKNLVNNSKKNKAKIKVIHALMIE